MAKLLRHLGLGCKKYKLETDDSEQRNSSEVSDAAGRSTAYPECGQPLSTSMTSRTAENGGKRPLTRTRAFCPSADPIGGGPRVSPDWRKCRQDPIYENTGVCFNGGVGVGVNGDDGGSFGRGGQQVTFGSFGEQHHRHVRNTSNGHHRTASEHSVANNSANVDGRVVVLQDYCDPADTCRRHRFLIDENLCDPNRNHLQPETISKQLCSPSTTTTTTTSAVRISDDDDDDDYVVPFEIDSTSTETALLQDEAGLIQEAGQPQHQESFESDAYDEVYHEDDNDAGGLNDDTNIETRENDRPDNEYDAPWEWRRPLLTDGTSTVEIDGRSLQENHPGQSRVAHVADTEAVTMLGPNHRRPLHIYETAFDSNAATKSSDEDLEIGNHPILTGVSSDQSSDGGSASTSKSSTPKLGGSSKPSAISTTTSRLMSGTASSEDSCHNDSPASVPKEIRHVVRAIVHPTPPPPPTTRSANSTPTLSYRAKEDGPDSRTSSAKSTPTRYSLARIQQQTRRPCIMRQFGELSLTTSGCGRNVDAGVGSNIVDGMLGARLRLPSDGVVSSEESVASSSSGGGSSASSSGASTNNNRRRLMGMNMMDNDGRVSSSSASSMDASPTKTTQNVTDCRLAEPDYDPPWEFRRKAENFKTSSPPMTMTMTTTRVLDPVSSSDNSNDVPIKSAPNKPSLNLPLNIDFNSSSTPSSGMTRNNLSLNLNSMNQKRVNLQLNFGCANLICVGETVDPELPLERQSWYHGAISRVDAENLLRVLKEGSFLVRNSESSKMDYSLSLKSTRGFMHMKIVYSAGKYILGQFSKPFNSIPEMVHHYSINKLPIRGAEHMSLLHPVQEQLL